jgi:hypothetical protein
MFSMSRSTKKFPQLKMWDNCEELFLLKCIFLLTLWPNIRFLSSIVAEKNATKNVHIHVQCMLNVYKSQLSRQTGSRNLTRFWTHQIPTSCLPTLLIFIHIEHTFCMPIFSRIFLRNYWWQKSDIWSQDMGYLYEACDQISDLCHQ